MIFHDNCIKDVILLELDKPTKRTGIIYPKEVICKSIKLGAELFPLSFGLKEYTIDLNKTAGFVKSLKIVGDTLLGDINIVESPYGNILQNLVDRGFAVGEFIRCRTWILECDNIVHDMKIIGFILSTEDFEETVSHTSFVEE